MKQVSMISIFRKFKDFNLLKIRRVRFAVIKKGFGGIMRFWNLLLVLAIALFLASGCGSKNKTMTIEDYAKIESEIEIPDPELDPERVESVTAKYGYTYKQYKEFYDKVQNDPELKEKLGEETLKKRE